MNFKLREEIVKHVFARLSIIPSEFTDTNQTISLMEKQFLLDRKITFEGNNSNGQVWGIQFSTEKQQIKILLVNCTQDPNIIELALLISLKDAPCFGLYLVSGEYINSETLIACSVNGKKWIECNTFLQANFLAGMEQIKETGLSWNKCSSYNEEFEKLISFIDYHQLLFGDSDAGEKD